MKLIRKRKEMIPGWCGSPKGLLQVLFERGLINETKLPKYSDTGKSDQKDSMGQILPEEEKYVLRNLMEKCSDFKYEPTAMEYLFTQLSCTNNTAMKLLTSPKYHCEIAGEGIEFSWGLVKKRYRNIQLEETYTKEKFKLCVQKCIATVSKKHTQKFASKARCYMMAYKNIPTNDLTYNIIEKFVKEHKCHRSVVDHDSAYITKLWKDSINI